MIICFSRKKLKWRKYVRVSSAQNPNTHTHTKLDNSLENRAVILVAPNENLWDGAQRLDEQVLIALGDYLILVQDAKQIPAIIDDEMMMIVISFLFNGLGFSYFRFSSECWFLGLPMPIQYLAFDSISLSLFYPILYYDSTRHTRNLLLFDILTVTTTTTKNETDDKHDSKKRPETI